MYIVFDTETTGLPRDWKAPVSQVDNWPRVVQLGWACFDAAKQLVSETKLIVQPVGFTIPKDAARIHGITQERALEEGLPFDTVLAQFLPALNASNVVVAHNLDYDEKVMRAEFIRSKTENAFAGKRLVCTKTEATNYCQLPGKYGFKWPTLAELHLKLFAAGFEDAHDALGDVRATARCYFELMKRGVVK
jgi:DNA polymerase III subunit epsilon